MQQYLDMGRHILEHGNFRGDRTGTGTKSVFGWQTRFDLQAGFPLLTTKKMFLKGIIHELLWFLNGDTNNNSLLKHGVHIWDEWMTEDEVPASFPQLLTNLRETMKINHLTNDEFYAVFAANPDGSIIEPHQRIPHDQITIGSNVYLEVMEMADKLEQLHGVKIKRTMLSGELGPIYGKQWCSWEGKILKESLFSYLNGTVDIDSLECEKHNQIIDLIHNLKTRPFSRRHVISAWNVADLPDESLSAQENVENGKMALAPCHCLFQFYVREMSMRERIHWIEKNLPEEAERINLLIMKEIKQGNFQTEVEFQDESDDKLIERNKELFNQVSGVPKYFLDCQLYQRSADFCAGVPFNIASYALLTMMIAQCVDMLPGEFIHTFGDLHMYNNHIKDFETIQLPREPKVLPTMWINPEKKDIFSFTIDDFKLSDYDPHPSIKYKISV